MAHETGAATTGLALVAGYARPKLGGCQASQWWLVDGGETVAFIQVLWYPDRPVDSHVNPALTVCDIEVREPFRSRGYGRAIIAAVEREFGAVMHTSGNYTPLGFAALGAHLPVENGGDAQVHYEDMPFVADWTTREPKYPL